MTSERHLPVVERNSRQERPKVGVYVCHCGGNISDVVDVNAVADAALSEGDVAVSKEFTFMCSDPGQNLIIEDIASRGVKRVVVAACSPALHEGTFRRALQKAGLNPYLYQHVNVREQ
jgi:heterodisulfide reductase subunit A2